MKEDGGGGNLKNRKKILELAELLIDAKRGFLNIDIPKRLISFHWVCWHGNIGLVQSVSVTHRNVCTKYVLTLILFSEMSSSLASVSMTSGSG